MKLDLGKVDKRHETAIQNFFRETKYLIFVSKEGFTKTLVLE